MINVNKDWIIEIINDCILVYDWGVVKCDLFLN